MEIIFYFYDLLYRNIYKHILNINYLTVYYNILKINSHLQVGIRNKSNVHIISLIDHTFNNTFLIISKRLK